jgi:hypothetical protein
MIQEQSFVSEPIETKYFFLCFLLIITNDKGHVRKNITVKFIVFKILTVELIKEQ